jgi:hypothetical protein
VVTTGPGSAKAGQAQMNRALRPVAKTSKRIIYPRLDTPEVFLCARGLPYRS